MRGEFVQIVGDSIGLDIPDASAKELACHVSARLEQIIQLAKEFSRNSNRGSSLQPGDIASALRLLRLDAGLATGLGLATQPPGRAFQQSREDADLFHLVDPPVSISALLERGVPSNVPPEPTVSLHWLAIRGTQPKTPLNPGNREIDEIINLSSSIPSSVTDAILAAKATANALQLSQASSAEESTNKKRSLQSNSSLALGPGRAISSEMIDQINATPLQLDVLPGASSLLSTVSSALVPSSSVSNIVTVPGGNTLLQPHPAFELGVRSSSSNGDELSAWMPSIFEQNATSSMRIMDNDRPALSAAQNEFLSYSMKLICGPDEALRCSALESISKSEVNPLIPYIIQFLSQAMLNNISDPTLLSYLLRLARIIVTSEELSIEGSLEQLLPTFLSLCFASGVGSGLSSPDAGQSIANSATSYHIRASAAEIFVLTIQRFEHLYSALRPRALKTVIETLTDTTKPLTTRVGALLILEKFGPEINAQLLLPLIIPVTQAILEGNLSRLGDDEWTYSCSLLRQHSQYSAWSRLSKTGSDSFSVFSIPMIWVSLTCPTLSLNTLPSHDSPILSKPKIYSNSKLAGVWGAADTPPINSSLTHRLQLQNEAKSVLYRIVSQYIRFTLKSIFSMEENAVKRHNLRRFKERQALQATAPKPDTVTAAPGIQGRTQQRLLSIQNRIQKAKNNIQPNHSLKLQTPQSVLDDTFVETAPKAGEQYLHGQVTQNTPQKLHTAVSPIGESLSKTRSSIIMRNERLSASSELHAALNRPGVDSLCLEHISPNHEKAERASLETFTKDMMMVRSSLSIEQKMHLKELDELVVQQYPMPPVLGLGSATTNAPHTVGSADTQVENSTEAIYSMITGTDPQGSLFWSRRQKAIELSPALLRKVRSKILRVSLRNRSVASQRSLSDDTMHLENVYQLLALFGPNLLPFTFRPSDTYLNLIL